MVDRSLPADPSRVGRGQPVHSGANDVGLLAPTPLVFGVAGAIALPAAAAASSIESEAVAVAPASRDAGDAGGADSSPIAAAVAPVGPGVSFIQPTHLAVASVGALGESGGAPVVTGMPFVGGFQPSATVATTAATTGDVSNAVDAVRASADALSGALHDLATRLDDPASSGLIDAANTFSTLGQVMVERVDSATDQPSALLGEVGELAASGGEALETVASGADALLGDAVSTVADTTEAVFSGVADTADAALSLATPVLTETVATVTDTASSAVTALDDIVDVTGLAGVDPVAGIATLTGMVSDAEGFEIVPAGIAGAEAVFASVGDLPDTIDTVVDALDPGDDASLLDSAVDIGGGLLGDHHGLGGLFGGDHDHG